MTENQDILHVTEEIAKDCSPLAVILISQKHNLTGDVTSFKLGIIVSDDVKSISELECKLYLKVDSEIPYDLVLYKLSEWNSLKNEIGTFAWKINNSGVFVYGQRI